MEVLCRLSYSGGIGDDSNVTRRLLPLLLAAVLSTCTNGVGSSVETGPAVVTFVGGNPTRSQIFVQVADSSEEREKGLMGVTELPADSGMAFVWDEPTTGTFWMKNTLIPLSIAFVDPDGRIVTIRDMQPCATDDACPTYRATVPYMLAIEVNAGFFDRNGIEVGDRAELGTGPAS
jgi:uncharacterized membrane protein (UPF0127 family)